MKLDGATRGFIGRRSRKSGVRGKPKTQAPEAPKDERFEATRRSVAGKAGRCRRRDIPGAYIGRRNWKSEAAGKLEADALVALKDSRIGATRGPIAGRAGRCKNGETRNASIGATGEIELRGNPELENRWKRRKTRVSRQLEVRTPAEPEDAECGATCIHIGRRYSEVRDCGVTREPSVGSVEGCEERKLESSSRVQTLRCRIQGNLET